jgi:hypothetical protein
MKNNSIADFVAASMDAALKSQEYKTLFGTQYKTAGEKCAKCHKDMEDCMCDSSMADDQDAKKKKDSKDSSMADDNDARKHSKDSKESSKDSSKDSSKADDQFAKHKKDSSKDSSMADDDDNDGNDGKDPATGATVSAGGSKIEFKPDTIKGPKSHADDHSANTLDSSTKNPYPGKQYDADEYRNADVLRADDADDEKVSSAYNVAIDSLLVASAALDSIGLGQGSSISLKLASLVVEAKKKDKDSKKDSKKSSKDSNSAKDKKKDSKDSKKDSHSAKDKKSDKSSSSSKDSKDSKDSKKSSKK